MTSGQDFPFGGFFLCAVKVFFRSFRQIQFSIKGKSVAHSIQPSFFLSFKFHSLNFSQMSANRFLTLIAFALCAIQLANAGPILRPPTSCDTQQVV